MDSNDLKAGVIASGPRLPAPIQILAVTRLGDMFKVAAGRSSRLARVQGSP